jgi:hypothetical protein
MSGPGPSNQQHTTSRAWRFRRCPSCQAVRAASEFRATSFGPSWTSGGRLLRCCPNCGCVAETHSFPVVRERHGQNRRGGRHGLA